MKTSTPSKSSSSRPNPMRVPPLPWIKTSSSSYLSSSSTPSHTKSNHNPSFPSSPIHHNHSPSLKDLHTLLTHTHNTPPYSPLHKHSLPSPARTRTRTRAHHHSLSFKDIESILSENNNNPLTQTRKPSIFHRVKTWAHRQAHAQAQQPPPNSSNKVVVYYTSLHVVRKTYNDCRAVRSILKSYNVKMDERDLSMDKGFVEELDRVFYNGKKKLPLVFFGGKYVGGVDEIQRLEESGDLKKLIQGLERGDRGTCQACGGFRFSVCEWCDGSHKVFVDNVVGFKSCSVCNVNGLVFCGFCS